MGIIQKPHLTDYEYDTKGVFSLLINETNDKLIKPLEVDSSDKGLDFGGILPLGLKFEILLSVKNF